ncbi:MAG: hypothetical protein IMW88_09195 [Thermoflavifilum sp.]|uniref:hypothetical protein n=1 Tax=Thermoflavifilum sp. TaxID=1968839 RepID=UPI0018A3420C|nr:hypothetical protein [Thermoflavifilum sp.]QOR75511.1 MAG: hypothetical protein IMW88_09195 [Thermoflavifilum sp.]
MQRIIKKYSIPFMAWPFMLMTGLCMAQSYPCAWWPAPCPNTSAISLADEVPTRKRNGALDEGLAFQRKMRNQLTDILQKTARQNGWQVYQLTDEYFDGPPFQFISFSDWEATPYEKRPPVWDDLAFIIIVNKDSLMQWRKWTESFLQQMNKNMNNESIEALQQEQIKNTTEFTESSIVLVHFGINSYNVTTGMQDAQQRSLIPQHPLQVPGAFYAGLLVNKRSPDIDAYKLNYKGYFFNDPAAVATILFGDFQPRNAYNNWRPAFEKPLHFLGSHIA